MRVHMCVLCVFLCKHVCAVIGKCTCSRIQTMTHAAGGKPASAAATRSASALQDKKQSLPQQQPVQAARAEVKADTVVDAVLSEEAIRERQRQRVRAVCVRSLVHACVYMRVCVCV